MTMDQIQHKIVRAALRFDRAWECKSIDHPDVYNAATSVIRAVRQLHAASRTRKAAKKL